MDISATSELAESIKSMASQGSTIKELAKGRSDLYMLNPFNIQVRDGFNTRGFDTPEAQEALDALAQSISKEGVKRPLLVRMVDNVPTLVDGERRLRAVFRAIDVYGAEIRTVRVELAPRTMTDADATLQIALQNDGLPLSPLERGLVFARLVKFGWTPKEIAESAGISALRVTQLVELTALPAAVRDMIRDGQIAPTLAWEIARDSNFDEAATIAAVTKAKTEADRSGRKKVTARSAGRPSFKSEMVSAFSTAQVETGDEEVVIRLSRSAFDQIRPLLKMAV